MPEVEFRRGDLVRYNGEVYKVRNVRTDRHRGGVYTTAKITRREERVHVFVKDLELVKRGDGGVR